MDGTIYGMIHFTFVYVTLFAILATLVFLPLALVIMPLLLNRKLNPLFGPKPGEQWEPGKSAANPYHLYFRSFDYAKAILFESFARKKYSVGREDFRRHVKPSTIVLCWIYCISTWISMTAIAIFTIHLFLKELGVISYFVR